MARAPDIRPWVYKAEEDFRAALTLARKRGTSGFRVANRGGAEYAEGKSNGDIILNKPFANSASLW